MAEQETIHDGPTFDPNAHGLWQRFIDGGRINHAAWLRAVASSEFVGTCRVCGSYLRPLSPDDRGDGRLDYEAQCTNEWTSSGDRSNRTVRGCSQAMCAPGGRLPGTAQRETAAKRKAERESRKKAAK